MARCDKWVAVKIVEFLLCVACLVAKRVSTDDEARLALLLQKLSREWSLLTSVTWDSAGGSFADATYGGYVVITFGLLLGRIFHELPKGRRIIEGWFLGMGMLFFLVLGGLELASLDSIPHNLAVNAIVLGTLSLIVAALFLIDLMGPRTYFAARHSQTDVSTPVASKKVSIITQPTINGHLPHEKNIVPTEKQNGFHKNDDKAKQDTEIKKEETSLFDEPKHPYTKYKDVADLDNELEKSKYGSLRNDIEGGNYIRLSDPMAEPDRLHYEKELAKFNENYFRDFLNQRYMYEHGKYITKEDYLPEPQTPLFSNIKGGKPKTMFDDESPNYEPKRASKSPSRVRTIATPTLQQLEDYLKNGSRSRSHTPALFPMEPIEERVRGRDDVDGRASGTPTDPGFVQYSADRWPDKRDVKTPRHSPTN